MKMGCELALKSGLVEEVSPATPAEVEVMTQIYKGLTFTKLCYIGRSSIQIV